MQLLVHLRQVGGRVLHVDQDPVEAGAGADLRGSVAGQAEPAAGLHLAGAQVAFQMVDWKIHLKA